MNKKQLLATRNALELESICVEKSFNETLNSIIPELSRMEDPSMQVHTSITARHGLKWLNSGFTRHRRKRR